MTDDQLSGGLSAAELAERAGASEEELERMVALGILVPRPAQAPFLPSDVQKVLLAKDLEVISLPVTPTPSAPGRELL